jgi:DNA-binding response OmpR family regulator
MVTAPASKNWKKTVLAVDDEPMILSLLGMALRAAGYVFLQAGDGKACLAKLTAGYEPDIIILDVGMPGMDGMETCRRIRSDHPSVAAPIIFLTAKKTREDVKSAQAAGGDDFIIKPFQVETVLKRVDYWLKRKARAADR